MLGMNRIFSSPYMPSWSGKGGFYLLLRDEGLESFIAFFKTRKL
jgi:hypothetical protein